MPNPLLLIQVPGQAAREFALERDSYTLGRGSENDIVIDASVVSRRHSLLKRVGDGWVFEDLDSRNGTHVDCQRVQRVDLREGTRLQLGKEPGKAVMITFAAAGEGKPASGPRKEAPKTMLMDESLDRE